MAEWIHDKHGRAKAILDGNSIFDSHGHHRLWVCYGGIFDKHGHQWGEKFNRRKWDKLTRRVYIYKLAFRVNEELKMNKDNYYNFILNQFNGSRCSKAQ